MKHTIFLIAVFSLFGNLPVQTQNIQETLDFADQLYQEGKPSEALEAYLRVAYFDRMSTTPDLLFRIADCYFAAGELEKAIEYYDHSYFALDSDSLQAEAIFSKSSCYLQTRNWAYALMELLSLDPGSSNYLFRKKELYLGICYYELKDFNKAEPAIIACLPDTATWAKSQIAQRFSNPKRFEKPNPDLAFWLSVFIPGAGQLYAGDWREAVNSFLLNGFLVGLTIFLANDIHPLEATLTTLPWFQRYYQGGFEKARDMAKKEQDRRKDLLFKEILGIIEVSQ